ncbi:hypothetical protein [Nocardia brasiliensis]|uniref:hypothetical protein n=1 Tax=Nocardia brasiliensis TaxID=37326 RepID=UPI002456EC36|nr:hypothetical protein [Nocardia brasiliensis]
MATTYHGGSAEVTILPDASKFFRKLRQDLRDENFTHTVELKPNAASLRNQIRDALKGFEPKIRLDADMTKARETVRAWAEITRPKINVDVRIDANSLRNQLNSTDRYVDATWRLDMENAHLRMREFQQIWAYIDTTLRLDMINAHLRMRAFAAQWRNMDVSVNLDLAAALAQMAALQRALGGLGGTNQGVQNLGTSLAGLANPAGLAVVAIEALAAVSVLPLIGQLAHAAVALAALGPAAGAAFAGIGAAVAIATSGVGEAFQAAKAESEAAGKAGEQAAKAQAQAQRQLANAVDSATQTQEQGERRITSAKRAAKDAEDALTRARKAATEQMQDLHLAVTGGALDEESAQIAVDRARERLAEVNAFGSGASSTDRREADLAYRQSIQRLKETQERNGDLREELAASDKAGIEGSDLVVQAKERQADAETAVSDAVKETARANTAAAQQIADAQQAVADAFEAGGDAARKYQEKLEALSPNARDFVKQVRALGDDWSRLRNSVQDAGFAGLGDSVTRLADAQLPTLQTGLTGIADVLNGGIRRGLDFLSTEGARLDLETIFNNTREAVRWLVDGLGELGGILWDVAVVGSKFLPGLGKSFADTAGSWRDSIHQMREDGSLEKFIGDGIEKAGQFLDILKNLGKSITSIFVGSNETGETFLDGLQEKVQKLADWLGSPEGQQAVKDFFTYVKNAAIGIGETIKTAVEWGEKIAGLFDKIGGLPLMQSVDKIFGDDKSAGERLLGVAQLTGPGQVATIAWGAVKDKVGEAKDAISGFVDDAGSRLSSWGDTLSGWATSVGQTWDGFTGSISDGWDIKIGPAFDRLKTEGFGGVASAMLEQITNGAVTNWKALPSEIGSGVADLVDRVFPGFKASLGKVRDFFGEVVTAAKEHWQGLKDAVREPVNWVINTVINGGIGKAWKQVDSFLANRLPDWVDVPGLARGGLIPMEEGAQAGKDSVLRNLMPGEFVLSVPAVQAAGVSNLAAFNAAALGGSAPSPEGLFAMAGGGEVTRDDPAWEAFKRGHDFARAQDGKPYQWAGPTGPGSSFDCSGFMGSIAAEILGKDPWQRYFATSSFTPAGGPLGFVPGLGAGLAIGVHDNPGGDGGGHTAGTLSGVEGLPNVNVESSGVGGVRYGGSAAGAADAQFPWKFHLPLVDGAFVDPGPGGTGAEGQRGFIARKAQELYDGLTAPLAELIRSSADTLLGGTGLKELPGTVFEGLRAAVRDEIGSRIDGLTDNIASLYDKVKGVAEAANPLNWLPAMVRDQGGVLKPGASLVYNGTGANEWILNPEWAARIDELVRALSGQPATQPDINYTPESQDRAAHQVPNPAPAVDAVPPASDKWAQLGQSSLSKVEAFAKENWAGMAESLFAGVIGSAPTTINAVDVEGAYREMRRRENMRRTRYRVRV